LAITFVKPQNHDHAEKTPYQFGITIWNIDVQPVGFQYPLKACKCCLLKKSRKAGPFGDQIQGSGRNQYGKSFLTIYFPACFN